MNSSQRSLLIFVGAGIGAGLFLLLAVKVLKPKNDAAFQAALRGHHPPGGDINFEGSRHPGDVEKGTEQLRTIYQAILSYRKVHGELPLSWADLEQDHLLTDDDLKNDDVRYSDHYRPGAFNQFIMWQTRQPRPDGSKKPPTPPPGERDLWLVSDLYLRHASRSPDGKDHGFYLALYSDGAFEQIPIDKVLMVKEPGTRNWEEAMPDQAGMPRDAITYAEYASKRGLRGKP